MKHVGDIGLRMDVPEPGVGKAAQVEHEWVLESFSDSDWSGNKDHRRSSSCGAHFLNGAWMFGSRRSQKTISLSSCESELHSLVSTVCDGIFLVACAKFVLNADVHHIAYTDSSSARQISSRLGFGRLRL